MSSEKRLFKCTIADKGKVTGYQVIGEVEEVRIDDTGLRRGNIIIYGGNFPYALESALIRKGKVLGETGTVIITSMKKLSRAEELGWRL